MILRVFLFWVVEFFAFLLATLNFRYCAKGHIGKTFLTDILIAANGFLVVKLVVDARTPWEVLGYIAGAGCGSLLAMTLTKRLEEANK